MPVELIPGLRQRLSQTWNQRGMAAAKYQVGVLGEKVNSWFATVGVAFLELGVGWLRESAGRQPWGVC